VGEAGQGNNWYPVATPPPIWPHSVDGKSQNVLWKAAIAAVNAHRYCHAEVRYD
jgi:hypothetical protein